MAEFTSGPWSPFMSNSRTICTVQHRQGFFKCMIVDPAGEIVAEVRGKTAEEAEANAILIAAAPDLYDALASLMTAVDYTRVLPGPKGAEIKRRALAALAKARVA